MATPIETKSNPVNAGPPLIDRDFQIRLALSEIDSTALLEFVQSQARKLRAILESPREVRLRPFPTQ